MVKKQKFGESPVNWAFHEKICHCQFQHHKMAGKI